MKKEVLISESLCNWDSSIPLFKEGEAVNTTPFQTDWGFPLFSPSDSKTAYN